jgi:hypothetical protein
MPSKVRGVAVEHALHAGRVVDVALLARSPRDGAWLALPVAAVEVRRAHAVDEEKALDMAIPWLEVDADQVCEDGGRVLVAVRDKLIPWFCAEHTGERGRALRESRAQAVAMRAAVKKLPFKLEEFPGFRVGKLARCPRGHEAIVFDWDGDRPPWPRPPLVVAAENEVDVSWRPATKKLEKMIPWRRAYTSVCGTCGERVE